MMNQEDLLKKTGNILKELQDQFDYLARDPQKLSELELELFLANAHFLSDHVQILKKVATTVQVHALPEHTATSPQTSQPQTPVNVYDELFKPDVETPTFEFIVHDQLKERSAINLEPDTEIRQQLIDPDEEEEILAEQDETIAHESDVISQPILVDSVTDYSHSESEQYIDAEPVIEPEPFLEPEIAFQSGSIPELQSIKEPVVESELQALPDPEEDEIGPEPFLVSRPEPTIQQNVEPVQPSEQPVQQHVPQPVERTQQTIEPVQQTEAPFAHDADLGSTIKHQPNLNELLASKSSVVNISLSESGRPVITDLKSSINLNEKLLFTKELFDGYNLAYAEAIDLVNKMPDFKSADKFLQANYAIKHKWASKPGTVEQLYDLLHQRFPK
jgi:hypothetical protein